MFTNRNLDKAIRLYEADHGVGSRGRLLADVVEDALPRDKVRWLEALQEIHGIGVQSSREILFAVAAALASRGPRDQQE